VENRDAEGGMTDDYPTAEEVARRGPQPEILGGWSFEFYLDPGGATVQQIADLLLALNQLHRGFGGSGLTFSLAPSGSLMVRERETK
jgi:hypothetical protein